VDAGPVVSSVFSVFFLGVLLQFFQCVERRATVTGVFLIFV
jgi:hypothetical protein